MVKRVPSVSQDGLRVYASESSRLLLECQPMKGNAIRSMHFASIPMAGMMDFADHQNGAYLLLLVGHADGSISVMDARSGQMIARMDGKEHVIGNSVTAISAVCYSQQSKESKESKDAQQSRDFSASSGSDACLLILSGHSDGQLLTVSIPLAKIRSFLMNKKNNSAATATASAVQKLKTQQRIKMAGSGPVGVISCAAAVMEQNGMFIAASCGQSVSVFAVGSSSSTSSNASSVMLTLLTSMQCPLLLNTNGGDGMAVGQCLMKATSSVQGFVGLVLLCSASSDRSLICHELVLKTSGLKESSSAHSSVVSSKTSCLLRMTSGCVSRLDSSFAFSSASSSDAESIVSVLDD